MLMLNLPVGVVVVIVVAVVIVVVVEEVVVTVVVVVVVDAAMESNNEEKNVTINYQVIFEQKHMPVLSTGQFVNYEGGHHLGK